MNKTVLVIGIISLLIGVSVVSSTEPLVDNFQYNYNPIESNNMPRELLSNGKIAYGSDALNYDLVKFPLDDPDNIEIIAHGDNTYWLTGGTWSYEHGWFAAEYNSGSLWLIDPETGDMENIGGGGTTCGDLAWDDWTSELYCAIGMMGLAFNSEGICYGVGGYGSNCSLYLVDFDPFEETLIGPLINFTSEWNYPLDAEFDKDTNIFYILTSEGLYTCDTETCECTYVGNTSGLLLSAFAIPYEDDPPVTTISFNPAEPDGCNGWYVSNVTCNLTAKDDMSGVNATYYRINKGIWKIYESPFVLSEDGDDILIEYYSVDDNGNVEDVKSATIDIDKTPPNITVEWDVEKVGWREWLISFTITIIDNASGSSIDRLEIFMNEGLQTVIPGSGPTYGWSVVIFGDNPVDFKFIAYDTAGNYAVVEVTSTEISYHNSFKDIFTQQSINPFILRLVERFPLLERLLDVWRSNNL